MPAYQDAKAKQGKRFQRACNFLLDLEIDITSIMPLFLAWMIKLRPRAFLRTCDPDERLNFSANMTWISESKPNHKLPAFRRTFYAITG